MTAVRLRIFEEIERRLNAIPNPTVKQVRLMPSGDPSRFNALDIFDNGDVGDQDEEEVGTQAARISAGIEGYVTGPDPYIAAHALYSAAIEAIFSDPSLGGLASEIRIVRLDMAAAERAKDNRFAFALELSILYHTRFGEPQQPA